MGRTRGEKREVEREEIIVPSKVRKAARLLGVYLEEDAVGKTLACDDGQLLVNAPAGRALRELGAMPIAHRTTNPVVILHYEWCGRDGSFEEDHACRLSSWVLLNCYSLCVDTVTMCYTGCVGKHSEVDAGLLEYHPYWARDVVDPDKVDEDDRFGWHNNEHTGEISDTANAKLEHACLEWLIAQAPTKDGYNCDSDPLPDWRLFANTFERVLDESPYDVAFKFSHAYKPDARDTVTKGTFGIHFEDPREAAYFCAARPTVTFTQHHLCDDDAGQPEMDKRDVTIDTSKLDWRGARRMGSDARAVIESGVEWAPPDDAWKQWSDHAKWDELVALAETHVAATRASK